MEQVLDEHRKKGVKIEVKHIQEGMSSSADPGTPLATKLQKNVAEVTGRTPSSELCPGLCEIRFFNQEGIPAYAFGPGLLEVSPGPGEFVRIPDVLDCIEIYFRTTLSLLG